MPTVGEAATATWVTTDGCSLHHQLPISPHLLLLQFTPTVQLQLNFRLYGSELQSNLPEHIQS